MNSANLRNLCFVTALFASSFVCLQGLQAHEEKPIEKPKVDILLAVDNSGSMQNIIKNIQHNAAQFLEGIIGRDDIDYHLGLISVTGDRNGDLGQTFLGFDEPFSLSSNAALNKSSVIKKFNDSLSHLMDTYGVNEYVFASIEKALTDDQSFRREDAHLVVIMITDEIEYSNYYSDEDATDHYNADVFLNRLTSKLDMDKSKVRFYGALEAFFSPSLGVKSCYSEQPDTSRSDNITYRGSEYERIINETAGRVMSACDEHFGFQMASIGKSIVSFDRSFRKRLSIFSDDVFWFEEGSLDEYKIEVEVNYGTPIVEIEGLPDGMYVVFENETITLSWEPDYSTVKNASFSPEEALKSYLITVWLSSSSDKLEGKDIFSKKDILLVVKDRPDSQ